MKKMTAFKKRTNNKLIVSSFNTKKFIKEFMNIMDNKSLSEEQIDKLLYNHCIYDKNSPLKVKKG